MVVLESGEMKEEPTYMQARQLAAIMFKNTLWEGAQVSEEDSRVN